MVDHAYRIISCLSSQRSPWEVGCEVVQTLEVGIEGLVISVQVTH